MAFSRTWDNTFPPDSQPANLLGQDIRNTKIDIQERMSAISGLDASKPSFEASFAGVLFFATDTGLVYQWSGATWVQVNVGGGFATYSNTTQVVQSVIGDGIVQAIPANAIQVGSYFEVVAGVNYPGTIGASATVGLSVGTANGVFSVAGMTHGSAMILRAHGVCQSTGISAVYFDIVLGSGLSTVYSADAANAVTPFAGFNIKTVCSVIDRPLNCDFIIVRVKK